MCQSLSLNSILEVVQLGMILFAFLCTKVPISGLGRTVEDLKSVLPEETKFFEKTLFSMCVPQVLEEMSHSAKAVTDVILAGIECHVCVLQTTLDLLEKNFNVHIAADCVSSRNLIDRFGGFLFHVFSSAELLVQDCFQEVRFEEVSSSGSLCLD